MKTSFVTTYGNPILYQNCPVVTNFDDSLKSLSRKMRFCMQRADGVGIAGNQIGTDKRIFVYQWNNKYNTVVNPQIIDHSDDTEIEPEGCLSLPGFFFPIKRYREIVMIGQDLDGKEIEIFASGYLARIIQHETDHLRGLLIVDHITAPEKDIFHQKWRLKKR